MLELPRRARLRSNDFDSAELKLILLSVHDEPSICRSAMEAGADAFVPKRAIATDLMPAIDAVLEGEHYCSPGVLNQVIPNTRNQTG